MIPYDPTTPTPPAAPPSSSSSIGPGARVIRTIGQTIIAVCIAIPAAVAVLPAGDASPAAWAVGIAGAVVIVVSAAQNALDHAHDRKTTTNEETPR